MDLNRKSLRMVAKKKKNYTFFNSDYISQHTKVVPFFLLLPSVKWEVMNPLSLLCHLTAMVIIFWRPWTSLRMLRKECIFAQPQSL